MAGLKIMSLSFLLAGVLLKGNKRNGKRRDAGRVHCGIFFFFFSLFLPDDR